MHDGASIPSIEALSVSRVFGRLNVVAGFDLTVDAGVVHGLIGPNGSGKTTILRLLAGLHAPTAGTIRVHGQDPESARSTIGWVPASDRSFYHRISGWENLRFFAALFGLDAETTHERAGPLLRKLGLDTAADRPVGEYSQGMTKRLALVRALIAEPSVLLCDELTHDLDPEGTATVLELVRERAGRGCAVVWATQRLDELTGFAHSVTVTGIGEIKFAGSMRNLLDRVSSRRFVFALHPTRQSHDLTRIAPPPGAVIGEPDDSGDIRVDIPTGTSLAETIAAFEAAGVAVTSCRPEESEITLAYRNLVDS